MRIQNTVLNRYEQTTGAPIEFASPHAQGTSGHRPIFDPRAKTLLGACVRAAKVGLFLVAAYALFGLFVVAAWAMPG